MRTEAFRPSISGLLMPTSGMSSEASAARNAASSVNEVTMMASTSRLLGSVSMSRESSARLVTNEGTMSYPSGERISMAPCRTDELNQLLSPPETSSRMRCVLPEASDDALFERVNRSSAAAASTRSLVAGATISMGCRDTTDTARADGDVRQDWFEPD